MATAQAWIIVVGTGLPDNGSAIVFGTSTSLPSTFTFTFSAGGGAGLDSIVVPFDIELGDRHWLGYWLASRLGLLRPTCFIGRAFGDEFFFKLPDKTLHRPRTRFAK